MKVLPAALAVTALVYTGIAMMTPVVGAEEWMLMGREGGCATIAAAAERRAVLSGITTPDQLVARLREQGEQFSRTDIDGENGVTVVQIDAPGRELGLIFVPRSVCQ
jgi:hypothetical protein